MSRDPVTCGDLLGLRRLEPEEYAPFPSCVEPCDCSSPAECLAATGGEQGLTAEELEIIRLRRELAERTAERDKARANYQFMVDRAFDQRYDGYLELGARAAAAENERDEDRRALANAEGRERVWAEQWAAVRDEASRLRDVLEDFARRLEWSACVLAPEAIDARSWARELRRVLGPTATTQPAPPAPGGPVVVEASGVEVVGTTKPGGDA